MKVKILAFGIAKEILGGSTVLLELNDSYDMEALKQVLEEKFPRLKQLSSFRIAINSHFASPREIITEQDEIAILPPVSGG
ncbi:MAG TPA: MoaD/ThiS family protein [Chitinophagales bacterium]|nr:MoaD/ThiS family protein [Chitinophagales bacterium]